MRQKFQTVRYFETSYGSTFGFTGKMSNGKLWNDGSKIEQVLICTKLSDPRIIYRFIKIAIYSGYVSKLFFFIFSGIYLQLTKKVTFINVQIVHKRWLHLWVQNCIGKEYMGCRNSQKYANQLLCISSKQKIIDNEEIDN